MILVGNQRGGAKNLALHLLKEENEHVEVHELKGFSANNLTAALNEAYAISRATRCRQYLYSLSLNPPAKENVPIADFEDAIERIEAKLGLSEQPRAVVFHEKEGRRHCHAVWSRIDTEAMKAVPLPFTKRKLQEIARELYLEHGWKMPRGLANSGERDPRNFTLAEWQQAKRAGKDPRAVRAAFQDAWAISDSKSAFIHALEERGCKIARGDRRGFVALDYRGEVYAIAKWTGVKTKQVRSRLGEENSLPSVAEVKTCIAKEMLPVVGRLNDTLNAGQRKSRGQFEMRRQELVARQRAERRALAEKLNQRKTTEQKQRQMRYRSGFAGIWDRLSGGHSRIKKQNEREAYQAFIRDREEKDRLVTGHLEQRRRLEAIRTQEHNDHRLQKQDLRQDAQTYKGMLSDLRKERLKEYSQERQSANTTNSPQTRNRGRSLER